MLPIIDFADFRTGDTERRLRVARDIGRALSQIGFFYVRGHGIAETTMQRARAAAEGFFAQPVAEKRKVRRQAGRYRGYIPPIPFVTENAAAGRPPILYEAFLAGADVAPDDAIVATTKGLIAPTPWPGKPAGFRSGITAYWDAVDGLARDLLGAFALSLDAPEDALLTHFKQPLTNLSLLHYPARPKANAETDGAADDAAAHYDTNAVTIVMPGVVGGLEVKRRDGRWFDAEPLPDCFIVNIGNMMECWSGGKYRSTMHRVHPPLGVDRFSIAHFAVPDYETVVRPLPSHAEEAGRRAAIAAGPELAAFVARFDDAPRE
ncbi:MAG TPA: 2-oxoglutarate and iron-dependent oxygenase domain-containing protein [Kiloniellaceae bacterium]|nr:2-oxoglutarate and iron-dependent oxygenase domain-containing protein [Kiloniellaceae bacterium]